MIYENVHFSTWFMKMVYENVHQQYMIYENVNLKYMVYENGLSKCPSAVHGL